MTRIEEMPSAREEIGVQLGRFAPYHNGHRGITDAIVERHGADRTLILMGSSNALRPDVPFTAAERREMIITSLPEKIARSVRIMELRDIDPSSLTFTDERLRLWRGQLKELEHEAGAAFRFYLGEDRGQEFFADAFAWEQLRGRHTDSAAPGLSGTVVRAMLVNRDRGTLRNVIHPDIVERAIDWYHLHMAALLRRSLHDHADILHS